MHVKRRIWKRSYHDSRQAHCPKPEDGDGVGRLSLGKLSDCPGAGLDAAPKGRQDLQIIVVLEKGGDPDHGRLLYFGQSCEARLSEEGAADGLAGDL